MFDLLTQDAKILSSQLGEESDPMLQEKIEGLKREKEDLKSLLEDIAGDKQTQDYEDKIKEMLEKMLKQAKERFSADYANVASPLAEKMKGVLRELNAKYSIRSDDNGLLHSEQYLLYRLMNKCDDVYDQHVYLPFILDNMLKEISQPIKRFIVLIHTSRDMCKTCAVSIQQELHSYKGLPSVVKDTLSNANGLLSKFLKPKVFGIVSSRVEYSDYTEDHSRRYGKYKESLEEIWQEDGLPQILLKPYLILDEMQESGEKVTQESSDEAGFSLFDDD